MLKFKGHLKIHRWWDGQLPLMMALVYFELSVSKHAPAVWYALLALVLFLVSSVGIASFGYLLNDYTDRDQDRQSGVHNLLARTRKRKIVIAFAAVILVSWAPWLALPYNPGILALIAFEYFLFIAYSVKPIRLKERGLPGSAADSLYGYAVPLTVALLLFAQICHNTVHWWQIVPVISWSFVLGLRHIFVHQLKDSAHDEVTGAQTSVTTLGWDRVFHALAYRVLPVECLLFATVLIALGVSNPLLPVGYLGYLAWSLYYHKRTSLWREANPWKLPINDRLLFTTVTLMSRFQRHWFPVLMLPALIVHAPVYLVFALVHFLLFENGFRPLFQYEIPEIKRIYRINRFGGTC